MINEKINIKHYMIIFGCLLMQAIPFSMAQNIPPLFVHYLHIDFNFNLASVGFIFTIGAAASSITSPFIGKLFNKISTKVLMFVGLIISCIGLFLNAFSNSLGMYLFNSALIQIGCITYSTLGIPYLIGTWFDKKHKATALGFAFAGGSMGNFFLQPIFTHLLHKYAVNSIYGLHKVYFIAASSALIVGCIILLTLIHNKKKIKQETSEKHVVKLNEMEGMEAKKALMLKDFWFLFLGMFFIGLNIAAQSAQYANYFQELKLPVTIIGLVGSSFALSCLIGNMSGGLLFSKIGILRTSRIAFLCQTVACAMMIVLFFTKINLFAFMWAIFYGFTVYMYTAGPSTIIQDLFGMRNSSEILGVFSISFAFGFAIGNVLLGIVVDYAGYLLAWCLNLVYILVGYSLLLISMRKILKKNYAEE